jgi:molecular chaperone GrpE
MRRLSALLARLGKRVHTLRPFLKTLANQNMNPTSEEPTVNTEANDVAPADTAEVVTPDPIAELQAEVDKWKDLALRSAAELDNYRKRTARDMQDARSYANTDLLRSLMPVLDTFEMGLDAARAESETSIVFQGLSMVRGMFQNFLKEQGVDEIMAQGQPFDPNLHEAMSQEASTEIPEGSVVRVLRRGYKLKDRLLRAATVVVSSGAAA